MKKINLFKIFTAGNEQKEKSAVAYTDFKGFFVSLGRKFWNLSNLNLLLVACNFPVLFYLFTLTGYLDNHVQAVANPLFPAVFGMSQISSGGGMSVLLSHVSQFVDMLVPSTATHVFRYIALLSIFTFGLSNAGAAYVIRGYNRAEPVFLITDFFGAVKRNIKQALVIGVIDIAFSALLVWDVLFWSAQGGYVNGLFFYFSIFLVLLYFIMRFYIYTLMITFKLSVYKIFKNAFIFAFLGIKRNIVGAIGIALTVFINLYLFMLFPPVGIALPAIITVSVCWFISGYTSYPVIKKYMIDPYYTDDEPEEFDEEEQVFTDRG